MTAAFHIAICKDLAVEEGKVVRASSSKALVSTTWVRRELIHEILRIRGTSEELVSSALASRVRLGASEIVDQLSTASWTFMSFLKLLLDHVLGLRVASDASSMATDRLGAANWSATVASHLHVLIHALLWSGVHLRKIFLIGERIRSELLCLLSRSLLIGSALILPLIVLLLRAAWH